MILVRDHKLLDILVGLVEKSRLAEDETTRSYSGEPRALIRVVQDLNRVLRVPGVLEFALAERSDLCQRLLIAICEQVQRPYGNVRQLTRHIEYADETWIDPVRLLLLLL